MLSQILGHDANFVSVLALIDDLNLEGTALDICDAGNTRTPATSSKVDSSKHICKSTKRFLLLLVFFDQFKLLLWSGSHLVS